MRSGGAALNLGVWATHGHKDVSATLYFLPVAARVPPKLGASV